jgi:hypothetical protein
MTNRFVAASGRWISQNDHVEKVQERGEKGEEAHAARITQYVII